MWPMSAMLCSTPHTTLSRTHLSIKLFAARMNSGPAMNLQTPGTGCQMSTVTLKLTFMQTATHHIEPTMLKG